MQSFGHGITFGRVCYVANVGAELLDMIEKSGLSITMTGDGLIATTMDALTEHAFLRRADWMVRASLDAKFKLCEEWLDDIRVKIGQANKPWPDENQDEPQPIGEIIFSV